MRIMTPRQRRRLANLAEDEQLEAIHTRYAEFLRAFGPADGLTDAQVAALADYCSDVVNRDVTDTVAEILRGRVWDGEEEFDEVNSPRVQAITRLACQIGPL